MRVDESKMRNMCINVHVCSSARSPRITHCICTISHIYTDIIVKTCYLQSWQPDSVFPATRLAFVNDTVMCLSASPLFCFNCARWRSIVHRSEKDYFDVIAGARIGRQLASSIKASPQLTASVATMSMMPPPLPPPAITAQSSASLSLSSVVQEPVQGVGV